MSLYLILAQSQTEPSLKFKNQKGSHSGLDKSIQAKK